MDKDCFINAGIPPPQPLQLESSMPVPWSGLNNHSFLDPNSSMDQYTHFEPTWGPMASTTTSALLNDAFALRELIGKLGAARNSTTIPPPAAESPLPVTNKSSSNGASCRTPLSSPKLNLPVLDQINISNLGNSVAITPLPSLSADPGFAERAAKFSNSPLVGDGKLQRVSSSPNVKQDRPVNVVQGSDRKFSKFSGASSNEESSVSEQIPSGERRPKTSHELNSRKRKAINRGKTKEDGSNSAKGVEGGDAANEKRLKTAESSKNETKTEEDTKGGSNDESEKQKTNQKPPEPPKDYIHVRARRGQATDSHSLAERVRREKISERMKLLQDLVPGCNKVTGKALMLDEIINYVQSLQRQVEFLSMKLATVNPGMDFNTENLLSKNMFQPNTTPPQQMYSLDSSGPAFYSHQPHQLVPLGQNPVDPLPFDGPSGRNSGIPLPSVDGFNESLLQLAAFSEDDLHSIVQMGFVNRASFPAQNQASNMTVAYDNS